MKQERVTDAKKKRSLAESSELLKKFSGDDYTGRITLEIYKGEVKKIYSEQLIKK